MFAAAIHNGKLCVVTALNPQTGEQRHHLQQRTTHSIPAAITKRVLFSIIFLWRAF
jgi:hypothetical protein